MNRSILLILALSLLNACETRIDLPADALVIRNGTVIDGTGGVPIPEAPVAIQGGRIFAVGPVVDFRIHDGTEILDAGRGFIIPGIINAHVHHAGPADLRHQFLLAGVTSVCDLGSPPEDLGGFTETEWDGRPAARGFRAGPIVTAPGGYPDGLYGTHINDEVAGPEEARAEVRELATRGMDMIKIALDPSWDFEDPIPTLDLETTRTIVEEAHSQGLLVRSHLIQPPQMELAIEAGVDVIEHLAMPRWPSREEENAVMASSDPVGLFFDRHAAEYQPRLERMASAGIAMVPTVSALIGGFYAEQNPTPRQSWVARVVMDIPRRLHHLGGSVAVGNDFNNITGKEMFPLLEMEMLLEAGLSPMDVIVAATRNGARVCGQGEELGTLEPGSLADLLVLDADPLADLVAAVQEVAVVVRGGEVVRIGGAEEGVAVASGEGALSDPVAITDDLEVQHLADGVWRHVSYQELGDFGRSSANGLVVVSGDEALLVDTPWTDEETSDLFDWIEGELGARVRTVIPTHAHPDNLGGLGEVHRRGAESVAFEGTVQAARGGGVEVPQVATAATRRLSVGDLVVELWHPGGGHTPDNSVAWIPGRGVLFGGCLVRSAESRTLGWTEEAELENWPGSIRRVLERFGDRNPLIVPGHGRPGGTELLERTLELLERR